MKVFVDTWGWISLYNKREARHHEVKDFYSEIRSKGYQIHTSDYVLDETFTLLFRRSPFKQAVIAMKTLIEANEKDYLFIHHIDIGRFESALERRLRYEDKPLISFTDLTSMVVMQELAIDSIMTADAHFSHVEPDFRLVPSAD